MRHKKLLTSLVVIQRICSITLYLVFTMI